MFCIQQSGSFGSGRKRRVAAWCLCSVLVTLLPCLPQAKAIPPILTTDEPDVMAQRPTEILVLSRLRPQPAVRPSFEELKAAYPLIQHRPFHESGFNALALPFLFVSEDGSGDPAEALSFSFLLSYAMDWSPGCYCSRHAYFVFKRSRTTMTALAERYDDPAILRAIRHWSATHAIGGTIMAARNGYSGTLLIYNRGGVAHRKEFVEPRNYFTLLGDMAVEAMTVLDQAPGEELAHHLRRTQCQNQSLIDLGRAAFLEERSRQEFGLYKEILDRDPDFGILRYWWANQAYWMNGDDDAYHRSIYRSLDSFLLPHLWQVEPDPKDPKRFNRLLEQTRRLTGPDSPLLLRSELDAALKSDQHNVESLRARVMAAVARYPNDYRLADAAANAMTNDIRFADANAAVALKIVTLENRFMTGTCSRRSDYYELASELLHGCGRADWAAGLAPDESDEAGEAQNANQMGINLWLLGNALMQLGQYETAAQTFAKANNRVRENHRAAVQLCLGVALALSGQRDRLAELIQTHGETLEKGKCLSILQSYLDLLDGKKVDTSVAILASQKGEALGASGHRRLLHAQACYAQSDLDGRERLANALRSDPEFRLLWVAFDAFDRRWPDPRSASFYDALEWVHPEDPWVRQAVADFRRRTPKGESLTAEELLKILEPYPPERWPDALRESDARKRDRDVRNSVPPGAFAAAIARLLKARDYATARELALRYHNLVAAGLYAAKHANDLIYRVEAASPQPARLP